ncbi:MAG: HAMP domain-containing protein, partial [Acidobacteria bacterium]|nr:HAMP domain-containing protein [Acidobacteriota bacterium]
IRHLRVNKLPLVTEFVNASLLDREGNLLLSAFDRQETVPQNFEREGFWYGPLRENDRGFPHPSFIMSTPVLAIQGGEKIGFLQIKVRADVWAANLRKPLGEGHLEGLRIGLSVPGGYRLQLLPALEAGSAETNGPADAEERITFSSPNKPSGWLVDVSVDHSNLTLPITSLIWKFLYVGLTLPILTALLLLPLRQFLLKPLAALQEAAGRIAGGDFSARVGYQSDDEVGKLSRAFDTMAGAIEQVTRDLARTADDLRIREAEIRNERDRLNTVIHSMEDGLFILDAEGAVTLSNDSAGDVLAELAKGRRGTGSRDCIDERRSSQSCFECLANFDHRPHACTVAIGARTFEIHATPLKNRQGREVARIFVSRDVSERMRQAAQQAHQERLTVLGEVAAVMAHEINNPLAAISMFSQMLLKGLDADSPLRTHAEVVNRNTETCKRAIRSLLDMATTSQSEEADFDLRDTVDDVVQLLRPIAEGKKIVLAVEREAEDGLIHSDELMLRQALVNLVMNAIQALDGREGGVVALGTEDREGSLVMTVEDNGPGIPPELRERVFEPFFTTKPPGEGTGLGLPTTRRIVKALGGDLRFEDRPEGGTIFEIHMRQGTAVRRNLAPAITPVVGLPSDSDGELLS